MKSMIGSSKSTIESPTSSSTSRLHSLDVLRGLALALVLLQHAPKLWGPSSETVSAGLIKAIFEAGWTGVDLFFVLSGFLISGILFKELDRTGRLDLKQFWLRRGLKIWPSYFVCYGLLLAVQIIFEARAGHLRQAIENARQQWPNLLFIQNYMPNEMRWPHSWTLAVEEHFYIALPLVLVSLAWLNRAHPPATWLKRTHFCAGALLFCALILALRLFYAVQGHHEWSFFYYPTHFRADSLCCGVIIGYLHRYRQSWFNKIAGLRLPLLIGAPLLLATAVVFPVFTSPFTSTWGFTLYYLAYGGLVLLAVSSPDFGKTGSPVFVLAMRTLANLGIYSYTIYLTHSIIYRLPRMDLVRHHVVSWLGDSIWADRFLFWGLSIVTGIVLSHLVERPCLRLRDKWLSRRHTPLPQVCDAAVSGGDSKPRGSAVLANEA
jgi:peptidoglycan/LPS O-acetylase OafA/YrhL